ncbi:preprotein translocase subunit SecY [Bartonella sp. DGB1]|uniref:preprotein translocase subunit SecY n=1 Tax=Bartonella sp. DGB1 TaxID=3239807 RepID=UPI003523962B
MASSAEQLASNMNLSTFSKAKELKARLWFTLCALIVYRFGTYVPIPGINADALYNLFTQHSGGVLGLFNMFAGGAIGRMAIFALGIMPYISASIIIQILSSVLPQLEAIKKDGESGRQLLNQYTRYLTVLFAVIQGVGLSFGLQSSAGLVSNPGSFFIVSTTITIVGGTVFLMWLGEQITSRGIGNGISLIIFAGIVAELPAAFSATMELGRTGALSSFTILGILLFIVAVIGVIVYFERAQRRLLIQYPKRQVGRQLLQGETSHLPLKLNTAGVIPPIFASAILLMPTTIVGFTSAENIPQWLSVILGQLSHGQLLYMILFAVLMVFFCFFYTAIVFNPTDTANQLKQHSGFIPGIRPGEKTAEYIDYVLTRITVLGAIYIVCVALFPELLLSATGVPLHLGGTSLLIMVNVALDTVSQIQSHLISQQYAGLLKKSRLKGNRQGGRRLR